MSAVLERSVTEGDSLEARILSVQEVQHVISLQAMCLNALPADQDLIHEKEPEDFHRILSGSHTEMLGIWEGGALIAQAVALFPDIRNPDADMLEMSLPGPVESVTTLAGVIVHPEHKGKRLMGRLIDSWHDLAEERGREHTLAMITDRNVPSLAGFLSGGLHVVDVAIDPEDDSTVYLAQGRVVRDNQCTSAFDHATGIRLVTPGHTFHERKSLFAEGFVGTRLMRDPNGGCTTTLEMVQF